MMKHVVFLFGLLFCFEFAWSQSKERKEELQGKKSSALAYLRLASDLVNYGYTQQSALPLINALQIMNEYPMRPLNEKKEGVTVDTTNTEGKNGMISLDYDRILADAKEFADGDNTLLELIKKIETERQKEHRGAVGGPLCHTDAVDGNSTDIYQINFIAKYLAEIVVSGDGDTDLDLYVYDSNGNLIASDTDYTDDCYVSWIPKWTGRFIVKIVNRGPLYNKYVLLTN